MTACAFCHGPVLRDGYGELACLWCSRPALTVVATLPRVPRAALEERTRARLQGPKTYRCVRCNGRFEAPLVKREAAHHGPYVCRAGCPKVEVVA